MNPKLSFPKKNNPKDVKVMFLDDDHFILNMYKIKFDHVGFESKMFAGGKEALEAVRAGYVPDVLFVDVIMPVMNGLEFLQTLRDEKLLEHVPIVMLTNQSQAQDIDNARKMGIHSYIVKATTIPSEIVDEIKNMFGLPVVATDEATEIITSAVSAPTTPEQE